MLPGILPENYEIPKFHGPSGIREFDDNALFLLKPNKVGTLTVEEAGGTFKVTQRIDILKLFKSHFNWTYSPLGEWEGIFRFFTSDELFDLRMLQQVQIGDYILHWIVGTSKMRLTFGNDSRTSRYLINVAPWVFREYPLDSLDKLGDVVGKMIWLNQYIPINPTSPSSTTKDLVLSTASEEFYLFNKLPLDTTKFLHSGYVGPRMESKCLGTIDNADNLDLERAYLRALGKCPSVSRGNIIRVIRGAELDSQAHPGSVYSIEAEVPLTYHDFAPLPCKQNGYTLYPTGKFPTKVTKPYIDLIESLGDIKYKILDSVQIILVKPGLRPFETFSHDLEQIQNTLRESLYPINLKVLHYSIQGHMLHIHKNVDFNNGHISYSTSQDYHPVDASAIQGMVACELYQFALASDTEAIRVDALSGYNLGKRNGYKQEATGLMTFLTPFLKDKPGGTIYRDLIYAWRDRKNIGVRYPLRYGVRAAWMNPAKIGRLVTQATTIEPISGNRDDKNLKEIQRVGDLLDRRITLPIPHYDPDNPKYPPGMVPVHKEDPSWVDQYLRLFPQTRT